MASGPALRIVTKALAYGGAGLAVVASFLLGARFAPAPFAPHPPLAEIASSYGPYPSPGVAPDGTTGNAAPQGFRVATDTAYALAGWAWSQNIGWISMSSQDMPGSPAYGVTLAYKGADKISPVSGYAWSPNNGWLRFDPPIADASSTADAPEFPKVPASLKNGVLQGWARFCNGVQNKDAGCAGPSRTDGYDGWVKLSGTGATPNVSYGVKFDPATGKFSGYAWGASVVGWVNFDRVYLRPGGAIAAWIKANGLRQSDPGVPLSFPAKTDVKISWGSAFDQVQGQGQCITGNVNGPPLHSNAPSNAGYDIGTPDPTSTPYAYTIRCTAPSTLRAEDSVSFLIQQPGQTPPSGQNPPNPGPQPPEPPVPAYHEY